MEMEIKKKTTHLYNSGDNENTVIKYIKYL